MRVDGLNAEPLPDGRVLLRWTTPGDASFRGVRILRRRRRFPDEGDIGTGLQVFDDSKTPASAPASFIDGPLQGEVVYYYAAAAYDAANQPFLQFVSIMPTVPYGLAQHLYRNLPEIYRLYDRTAPQVQGKGPLERFIELTGETFDLIRSLTAGMRTFHDVEQADGALLPLLAGWIGQPSDTTLSLDRQRNEIRYAPHYYRTAGTPANLRSSVNRFTNWDAKIKEFVHNVFLTSHPEQLTVWEVARQGAQFQPVRNVNLEVAFEGRVAPLRTADGRLWLFYHALRGGLAGPGTNEWQVFAKIQEQNEFLPSFPLTDGTALHKHPSAIERPDGSVWLFYSRYPESTNRTPELALELVSAGRPALPARVAAGSLEPFDLTDGESLDITINDGITSLARHVTVRPERFRGGLKGASAVAVATFLDRELPGVAVTAQDGALVFTTTGTGAGVSLKTGASTLTAKLGLPAGVTAGSDATTAQLTGTNAGPFALKDGDTLVVRVDRDFQRALTFSGDQFRDIGNASAAEVVAAIESQLPGVASLSAGLIRLQSSGPGFDSLVSVLVSESTAAQTLGFAATPPMAAAGVDEDEPAACVDKAGNVWLFYASRRDGAWKIWYTLFEGTKWAPPKALTSGDAADREPFALFDPAAGGRLWVFWSRKKANGQWNVFSRTTTNLNFGALTNADWTEAENAPVPPNFDNREPAATLAPSGEVELYFASNRTDGWNTWTRTVSAAAQGPEVQVTTGQATWRAPAPVRVSPSLLRVFLRSNETITYTSTVYPAAQTFDSRYSGSSTSDTNNPIRLSARGSIRDIQRYTYDVRRDTLTATSSTGVLKQSGLYARDCVGVYLTPDTVDQAYILRQRQLFVNALKQFVPVQVRLAFLIDQVFPEKIYTYDSPGASPQLLIGERMIDTILPEVLRNAQDAFRDRMPNVRFTRSWVPGESTVLPDLSVNPPDLRSRTFDRNFDEGA